MIAKELCQGQVFRYGRFRKPIIILKCWEMSDRSNAFEGQTRIYIHTAHGKDLILLADTPVFLFEPFETITEDGNYSGH